MRVAIGSDHAGFELKKMLIERLSSEYEMIDLGTDSATPPVDYPDYAFAVSNAVVAGRADRGIVVCGSGAGASIAADKVRGVRACFAGDTYTAHQSVEHDDANVLCLGERVTGPSLAYEIALDFLRATFTADERHQRRLGKITAYEAANSFPLEAVSKQGQSLWIDSIDRHMLQSGELRKLAWEQHVVGLTSNPTIFEKAMGTGKEYEAPAEELAKQGKGTEEIYWTLAIEDIQNAADVMRPIYDLTQGKDGYISLEVDPGHAKDTQATVDMAKDLWTRLARPNVMIKIPATKEGVPAVEEAIASGINVNVTLMFAVELYEEVAHAYVRGTERFFSGSEASKLARADSLVKSPASVASFFVSRVDTLVDKLLDEKIAAESDSAKEAKLRALQGKAAVANARLAYDSFKKIFAGPSWESLAAKGAQVQRPLWASTSTKNPSYRDVLYVEELIGPDTVNTLPPATLIAFGDHGHTRRSIDEPGSVEAARATMQALAEAGIDMVKVTQQLEDEGVKSFSASFDSLIKTLEERRKTLVTA